MEATRDRKSGLWSHVLPDGALRRYYQDGSSALEGRSPGGKRQGVWTTYAQGGEIVIAKGAYRDDWRDGVWSFHDDLGRLYLTLTYRPEPKRVFLFLYTHDYGNENGPYERFYPEIPKTPCRQKIPIRGLSRYASK